jgi:hypothetical protein
MPALAAYFAFSGAYLLVETGSKKSEPYKFFSFPYRYIPAMFGNNYDDYRFNAEIINLVAQEMGKKPEDYDILVAGKWEKPHVAFEPKMYLSLDRIYQTAYGLNPIYVSNRMVHTKSDKVFIGQGVSSLATRDVGHGPSSLNNEVEYLNNYDIYPQLSTIDLPTRLDFDRSIVNDFRASARITEDAGDLFFTGSKFAEKVLDPELDYILIMDMINTPGVYKIFKDSRNAFVLLSLLNEFHKKKKVPAFEDYAELVGTLIKIPGPLECYVGGGEGTGQVFDLAQDELFVVPIDSSSVVDITVKSPSLDKMLERKVCGGKIGLIFNSLDTSKLLSDDRRLLNTSIKFFNVEGGRI